MKSDITPPAEAGVYCLSPAYAGILGTGPLHAGTVVGFEPACGASAFECACDRKAEAVAPHLDDVPHRLVAATRIRPTGARNEPTFQT